MKISEIMTKPVLVVSPDQSIREAAAQMSKQDVGALPIAEKDRLVGMITDRDIAIRAVAQGKGPETKLREIMAGMVKYCFDDEEIDRVAQNMGDIQMRRLPVLSRHDKRLVGIVALGDLAIKADAKHAGTALEGVSQPNR